MRRQARSTLQENNTSFLETALERISDRMLRCRRRSPTKDRPADTMANFLDGLHTSFVYHVHTLPATLLSHMPIDPDVYLISSISPLFPAFLFDPGARFA